MDKAKKIIIRPSIESNLKEQKIPLFHEMFKKSTPGAMRGNMFLMIVTTTGSAFTFIPQLSKNIGIILMLITMVFPAFVSYLSSIILYWGFKATQAQTYDECMKKIMGQKMGLFSNFVILVHTFGSVIASWLFSFRLIKKGIYSKAGYNEGNKPYESIFDISYFVIVFALLFMGSLVGKIENLKSMSKIGLLIMLYLICLITYQMPYFFNHYNSLEPMKIQSLKFNWGYFRAYGICSFLFLNQYTIMPICNNLDRINSRRITKVIGRTITIIVGMYILVLFSGYFSLPNSTIGDKWQIFIERPSIDPNATDHLMWIGVMLFGINLLIGLIVKNHFFILYFHQMIYNTRIVFFSKKEEDQISEDQVSQIISEKIRDETMMDIIKEESSEDLTKTEPHPSKDFVNINKDEKDQNSFSDEYEEYSDEEFEKKTDRILKADSRGTKYYIVNEETDPNSKEVQDLEK